jgi:acyl-CoA synthetase (AMP-forming)/AMP-acid ligase II
LRSFEDGTAQAIDFQPVLAGEVYAHCTRCTCSIASKSIRTRRGYLYILDRKKDMIKPGGENVYSPEVESMIASHPEVLEVAVIGLADEKWGEAIKAVVARRPGSALTEDDMRSRHNTRSTHLALRRQGNCRHGCCNPAD